MDHPTHYRCKVNAAFGLDRKGKPVLGRYEKNSHHIVPASSCMIEDGRANEIAGAIFSLLPSFRIRVYDEDSGYGLLRHVQIRRSYATGQYMVTLVCTDPVFPSRQNFIKALRSRFPEIATIILNINDRHTSMVLGGRNIILYGKGYIEDVLCGCTFRISPGSFYQVNPPQTQRLYETALRYAALTGKETVLDAYCGTGTIGLIAAGKAKQVIGVELNADAVRDAVWNARCNKVKNIRFVNQDATGYMEELAAQRQSAGRLPAGAFTDDRESGKSIYPDVLILDPPRSGTTPEFIETAARMAPERIIYISCGPDTLARDLELFRDKGYRTKEAQGFDLFPYTEHVETVCLLSKLSGAKNHISVKVDMDEMDVTAAESKATYDEIREWVQENYGMHVTNLNIAQVKRKHGIIERENYNKPKSLDSKQPGCPEEKVKAIEAALRFFQMIYEVQESYSVRENIHKNNKECDHPTSAT